MQITRINLQVKNPDRVNIFVDGKYLFSLTINQLVDTKLKVGTNLTDQDITSYKKLSSDGKLEQKILNWLVIRPKSSRELKQYLSRNNVDIQEHQFWIEKFQKNGYQNDEYFAKWWVTQRQSKNRSTKYIKNELICKGISSDYIELAFIESDKTDNQALGQLIEKKRHLTKYKDNKKLTEYLIRQGFSYSSVLDALAE
jgi:regulatory protein